VRATRELDSISIGASVRGSLALERASRAWALLSDRDFVTPADVERVFLPVLGHRVAFTPAYLAEMRKHGWEGALRRFCGECFGAAPRPESRDTELSSS
jgi:MoxR-like ATPase